MNVKINNKSKQAKSIKNDDYFSKIKWIHRQSNILYLLIKINITLSYSYSQENLSFQNIRLYTKNDCIELSDVMDELQNLGVKNLNGTAISFYDRDLKYNIFCGIFPNLYKISINLRSIEDVKIGEFVATYDLLINSRFIPDTSHQNKIKMDIGEEQLSLTHEEETNKFSKTARRSKERKLAVIIEKVYMWRKLYNGYYNEKHEFIRLTLEDAAAKVGISKKSLDDYLNQLK